MEQFTALDDDSKFYKEYGAMDARNYMSELKLQGIDLLEDINLSDVTSKAESYFNLSFGECIPVGDISKLSDYKAIYVASFLRETSSYKKNLKEQHDLKITNVKTLRDNYSILAIAAAARWFVLMESSSDILKLKDEDLINIASDIVDVITLNKYIDKSIRASFIGSFVKYSKLMISSLTKSYDL